MPRFPLVYPSPELVRDRLDQRSPGRSCATTRDRVKWLLAHPRLWEGLYPELAPRYSGAFQDGARITQLKRLAGRIKAAGLYAPTTYEKDIAHALLPLLALARACRTHKVTP